MSTFSESLRVATFGFFLICLIPSPTSSSYRDPKKIHDLNWPVTLSYHETHTNALLGEALLKRVYARIGFTDNIIRAEVDTLFENLKEVIEKRLRKCERKRRSGTARTYNQSHEIVYNSHQVNASLANQYAPRRTTRY